MVDHMPPPTHHAQGSATPRPQARAGPAHRTHGQIATLILAHLRAYPCLEFSPYDLARVLGVSHGTARRHLLTLAEQGQVHRTQHAPARFQIVT